MLLALLLSTAAQAAVQRWAVLVGNNEGAAGSPQLYFAELDARKMQRILTDQGGVSEPEVKLLLGRSRSDVLFAVGALRESIAAARARGDQTVLYFYYSGHADATQLQLGRTGLTWTELEALLDKSGADVRVAFVDACQSGTITRAKGGTLAPSFVFDVSERLDYSGTVIITSSTGDEASQESDAIGGSYFTHFLASALTGAADENRDGLVTLSETYQYVYHKTVFETAGTRTGTQHPTNEWKLTGTGDLVMTELDRAGSTLLFPASNPGTFAVFDTDHKLFVAEVEVDDADRRLALRPGHYLVQRRFPTYLVVAKVAVPVYGSYTVDPASFTRSEYEEDLAKGSIDRVIARAKLPRLSARVLTGGRGFADAAVQASYFPSTAMAGAEVRFNWRSGQWMSADILGGSGTGELAVADLPYGVPTRVDTGAAGVAFGYATPDAPFRAGAGLRLEAFYLVRSFPDQGVPAQSIVTVAPGLEGWAGWYPGHFDLELQLRSHYLPYVVDDRDRGMGFNELLLGLGWRF
jgi:hypothetical protein